MFTLTAIEILFISNLIPSAFIFNPLKTSSLIPQFSICSLCDSRYVRSALFFKTLEGFVEAGPQFALQLSLLLQGRWGESSQSVLEPIIDITMEDNEELTDQITTTWMPLLQEQNQSLKIFDRIYDQGDSFYLKSNLYDFG